MKFFLNVLILLLQFGGVILIGIGLADIWTPLALIYAGIVGVALGNLIYRAMESEETEK